MRVMLLDSAAPSRWGGAEIWMRRAAGLLAELGHPVLALAPAGSPALPGPGSAAAAPSREAAPEGRAAGGAVGQAWSGNTRGLRRAVHEFRPEVAVALQHRDLRRLWWVTRGLPVRRAMARHLASERPSWRRRLYYARLCHAVWTPSEYMRARLVGLDRVAPPKVHVVRPSVPALPVRPDPPGPPTVACVGRLAREKGQDVLLRALASARVPARLVLVGRGREAGRLRSLAQSVGLAARVEWIDHLDDLGPLFSRVHLAAQPSRLESFGLAALEALARGVPVVASSAGGLPEVVGEGGALVPPGDPAALAAALDLGLGSPEVRAAWSRAAVTRAREHYAPPAERAALQAALEGTLG